VSDSPPATADAAIGALRRTLAITNKRGLHARAAAKFVRTAGQFDAVIRVGFKGEEVSALSIMGLMMLAAGIGSSIELTCSGRQATEAMAALSALVEKINRQRQAHIVTIEDPIELLYTPCASLVRQREVGSDTASFGNSTKKGVDLAQKQLNAAGGFQGKPVEVITYDDQSKPDVARTLYERLITVDKVDLIMGPYATANILAAIGVAQRYKKIIIHNTMGIPSLATYEWQFNALLSGADPSKSLPNLFFGAFASVKPLTSVTIVTSNVDPLHQLAGSKNVYQLHGDILETLCTNCRGVDDLEMSLVNEELTEETIPRCACGGMLRPNVVWFGEYPWTEALEAVQSEMPKANIVLEVGVSGNVTYGFSQIAARNEIPVIRINPDGEPEPGITLIKENSEVALPRLVSAARQYA